MTRINLELLVSPIGRVLNISFWSCYQDQKLGLAQCFTDRCGDQRSGHQRLLPQANQDARLAGRLWKTLAFRGTMAL